MRVFTGCFSAHRTVSYTFSLVFLLCSANVCRADRSKQHLTDVVETFTVADDGSGYVLTATVAGVVNNGNSQLINIYAGELEHVSDIIASYTDTNGKKHKIKASDIVVQSILTGSFFTGTIAHSFRLPDDTKTFSYSYKLKADNVMLLAGVPLNEADTVDHFSHDIVLPTGYAVLHHVYGDTASLKSWHIASEATATGSITHIVSVPLGPIRDAESKPYQVHKSISPVVQLIVVPNAYINNPFAHLKNWYDQLLKPRITLDAETKKIADKQFATVPFDSQPVAIFRYVQHAIHYIDIENGIGAFQPRDVNYVCNSKMGDCKDMANLLCGLLQYTGHKACMALSATIAHPCDMVFASLSSADHVICVLQDNGKNIYLDATESNCRFGLPSRQIQGRNIFMLDGDEGHLKRVPVVSSTENKTSTSLQLSVKDDALVGKAEVHYNGLGTYTLQDAIGYTFESAAKSALEKYLSKLARNLTATNAAWKNIDSNGSILLQADMASNRCVTHVGKRSYLNGSFQPWPSPLPSLWDSLNNLVIYNTVNEQVALVINVPTGAKLLVPPPVSFSKNGLQFTYSISQPTDGKIEIKYQCIIDHLVLDDTVLTDYTAMNTLMLQTLNKAVIYETE